MGERRWLRRPEDQPLKLSQGFLDTLAELTPNKPYGRDDLRELFGVESLTLLTPLLEAAQQQGLIKMVRTTKITTFTKVAKPK